MSGVFWEPSQQPDLMESVSAFGSSSASLALALPMFTLDLICSLVLYIGSTVGLVLGMVGLVLAPVIDVLGQVSRNNLCYRAGWPPNIFFFINRNICFFFLILAFVGKKSRVPLCPL